MNTKINSEFSRRNFLHSVGVGLAGVGLVQMGCTPKQKIQKSLTASDGTVIPGFETSSVSPDDLNPIDPFQDRKIKVGLVGYGIASLPLILSFRIIPT